MIGISSGVITIKIMTETQRNELHSFINDFFNNINSQKINNVSLLKYSISNNLKTTLVIWIMGLIILGVPITLTIVLFRGFTIGFSIGFIINDFGFKGVLLALLTFIPQNIFIIPGIIVISSLSVSYSINFIKNRKKVRNESVVKEASVFSFLLITACLFFLVGGIIEAYITPYLMKLIL